MAELTPEEKAAKARKKESAKQFGKVVAGTTLGSLIAAGLIFIGKMVIGWFTRSAAA